MKKVTILISFVILAAIYTLQIAYAAPSDGFPVTLYRGEYLYYKATQTLPHTDWRTYWTPIIPNYRNRAFFEVQNMFGDWVLEYTIDLVSSGGCSVENSELPQTCWEAPDAVFFDTDGGKVFQMVVYPVYLPLLFNK